MLKLCVLVVNDYLSKSDQASVFYVVSSLLTVIPPLLIAYRSQGFWIKTATHTEQPEIHFKHSVIGTKRQLERCRLTAHAHYYAELGTRQVNDTAATM